MQRRQLVDPSFSNLLKLDAPIFDRVWGLADQSSSILANDYRHWRSTAVNFTETNLTK